MNKSLILVIAVLAVAALFTGCTTAQQNGEISAGDNVDAGTGAASLDTAGDSLIDPANDSETEIGTMI